MIAEKKLYEHMLWHSKKPILPKKHYGLIVHSSVISCDEKLIKISFVLSKVF